VFPRQARSTALADAALIRRPDSLEDMCLLSITSTSWIGPKV
jgi:hypothetical protein